MTEIFDFSKAFRVNALSLRDKIGFFAGDNDPRASDTTAAPVGSVYFQTEGTVWKRSGADASAWVKLVAEDMMLLNLGLALGSDGWTHALQMAGQKNQELMVRDAQLSELLNQILVQQKITNAHMSILTDEHVDETTVGE